MNPFRQSVLTALVAVAVGLAPLSAPVRAQDDRMLADLRARAEAGDAEAQNDLGIRYQLGRGVLQDDAEALGWYRRAAEQGLALAQFNLGLAYDNGRGVPEDDTEAASWYRRAAEQGFGSAQANLGVLYAQGHGVPQDNLAAHMWLNLAAARLTGDTRDRLAAARDAVAARMTREDLAEAQRRAREWDAAHPR